MSVIEVANLHKRYGDKVAVDDVSFSVDRGEIFGILGPNGAGKSTTVECVTGVRRPDAGLISVLGFDPRQDREALRRRVGVQLQKCHLPPQLKVSEALRLYASFYPDPVDWRGLLDEFGLAEQRDTNYSHLSGGQQQRLSIALALVGNPEVVVLDELTTGLDPRARRATWDVIKRLSADGVTVVLAHRIGVERVEENGVHRAEVHRERHVFRYGVEDLATIEHTDVVNGAAAPLACGLAFFGADRVLFGTDMPFDGTRMSYGGFRTIVEL